LLVACGLLLAGGLHAAEITANKMAILNTEQGKVTVFEDGVTIVDGGTRIIAGKVEFYDAENRAVIHGGVSITTPTSQATADSAEYLLGAKKTYLYRNVTVRQEGLTITGQAMTMDNAAEQVLVESEVRLMDEARGVEVTGGTATFNLASNDGTIYGSPRLVLHRSSAMTVTGNEMELHRGQGYARVIGGVVATTSDAQLTCDTLLYFVDHDSARANGNPVLKQNENTVTGDLMSFGFEQGDLKRIDVAGTPKLVQKDGEITGEQVTIQFEKGKLAEIEVKGDSLHQPELKQERNHGRGDVIAFHFHDGEVQEITMSGKTRGEYLTDDKDRIEVEGAESMIRFRDGKPVLMQVASVREGRLYRHAGAK
jgi:lipopolysaccharide export system protein LptA